MPRTADSRLDYGWHGLCMGRGMLGHDTCIVHGSLWVTQLYRNRENVLCNYLLNYMNRSSRFYNVG